MSSNHLISTEHSGKAYLMVLQDIFELSAKLNPETEAKKRFDLRGFNVPQVMINKMRNFVKAVRTDPSVPDEELLQQAHMQVMQSWTWFFLSWHIAFWSHIETGTLIKADPSR